MLDALMKRPLVSLGILAGSGAVIVGTVLGVVLLSDDPAPDGPQFASASTEGPFITVESAEVSGDVGRAQPVRIRVEDAQGVAELRVMLGGETVWQPEILRGQKTVYTTYPWIPDSTGEYTFDIVARTIDDREATKSVTLSAGCCPPSGDVNIGYTVQPGDDPASIAANFGVCFEELRDLNPGLADIAPGDVLQIPYRPDSDARAGNMTEDECEPAPEGFFNNPEIRQNIPRRNTAYPVITAGGQRGRITRGFDCAEFFTGYRGTHCPDDQPWFHTGLDITLEEGAPITTIDGGTVTHAGADTSSNANCNNVRGSKPPHNGYGRHVRIQQGEFVFLYAHLSALAASPNDDFDGPGLLLGYGGTTGCSTGPHLHVEVRRGGRFIDPLNYIDQVEIPDPADSPEIE